MKLQKKIIKRLKQINCLNSIEYTNSEATNLKFLCSKCNNIYITSLKTYKLHTKLCSHCSNKNTSKIIDSINQYGCMNVEEYISNTSINLKFKCHQCNNLYTTSWANYNKHSKLCKSCMKKRKQERIVYSLTQDGCLNTTDYIASDSINLIFPCIMCNGVFKTSREGYNRHPKLCRDCITLHSPKFIPYYTKPTTLYYIRIGKVYKIGITTQSILQRFSSDKVQVEVLDTVLFTTGKEAFILEQTLLRKYKKFKYQGEPILRGGGNTELLTKDVLKGGFSEYRK